MFNTPLTRVEIHQKSVTFLEIVLKIGVEQYGMTVQKDLIIPFVLIQQFYHLTQVVLLQQIFLHALMQSHLIMEDI